MKRYTAVKKAKTWGQILMGTIRTAIPVQKKFNYYLYDFGEFRRYIFDNISLYRVSCIGIAVIAQLQNATIIYLFHKNYQQYSKRQENGCAEATSTFLSKKISFL